MKVEFVFISLALIFLTGCLPPNKQTQLEVQNLEERVSELELRVRENEARLYRNMEKKAKGQTEDASTSEQQPAPAGDEDTAREVPVVTSYEEAYGEANAKPDAGASKAKSDAGASPKNAAPTADQTAPANADHNEQAVSYDESRDVKQLYDSAMAHYHARRFSEADVAFRNIIDNAPQHQLAPNAMYWLGEVSYSQKNYNHALLMFERVVTLHGKHHKAADAQFKVAMVLDLLGRHDEAADAYQKVVDAYPKSKVAAAARERL